MNKLELIAQQLLEIETIDAADFNYLMDENRMPTPEEKKIWIEEKMRESLPNLQAEPESDSPEISEELSGDTEEKLTEN